MQKQTPKPHGTKHIMQSLVVNALIAIAKGIAAFFTGSGAMLAETIHSVADCGNQGLLLLGVKQSKRPPDEEHPLGYGRSAYFWSFMVAMLLFSLGGMFSIYEGIHKYYNPEPITEIFWGVAVLVLAIGLELYATVSNIDEINKRRGERSFFEYMQTTKDSDLVVVFCENSAAVLGLLFALIALLISYTTGDPRFDALGSLAIGVILISVAIFLAVEVHSLLLGESADPLISKSIRRLVKEDSRIEALLSCKTLQQGPGEILACIKIECKPKLTSTEISHLIDDFEKKLTYEQPTVKWLFVEPDIKE
jgi:cation diffusion facilitator family transporter